MNNYDYPVGSDNSNAPWNENPPEPLEIEINAEITIKRRVKIIVDDYQKKEFTDEERTELINDFSQCNLESAVKEQIISIDPSFDKWEIEHIETELI